MLRRTSAVSMLGGVTLAVVLIAMVAKAALGDVTSQLVVKGMLGFFGIGGGLCAVFPVYLKLTSNRKVNWALVFVGAFMVGMAIGLVPMFLH